MISRRAAIADVGSFWQPMRATTVAKGKARSQKVLTSLNTPTYAAAIRKHLEQVGEMLRLRDTNPLESPNLHA